MNCEEFEKNITELAQGISSSEALQHPQDCPRCQLRLGNVTALTTVLKKVADADLRLNPPPHLDTVLLAAFRQQQQKKIASTVRWFDAISIFFGHPKWGFAAAVLLVLFGLVIARMMPSAPSKTGQLAAVPDSTIAATVPPQEVRNTVPELPRNIIASHGRTASKPIPVQAKQRHHTVLKPAFSTSVEIGDFEVMEPEKPLLAKDFIAFDYAETMPPADNLQLMRVRVPREKIAPLGLQLPRNNRQSAFVNADLLVGSDGVPRAINVVSLH